MTTKTPSNARSPRKLGQETTDSRFDVLCNKLPLGVLIVDACGIVQEFNARAADILGLQDADNGSSIFSHVVGAQAEVWFEAIEAAEGSKRETTEVVSARTSKTCKVDIKWCRILSSGGFAWLMLLEDVRTTCSEGAQMVPADKLHHDLLNPIASILGFVDILSEDADEDQAEFLGYIKESAERLRLLANSLRK